MSKMKVDDAVTILVRLVNIAQKRGVFALEESYLAFTAIATLSDDLKLSYQFLQVFQNISIFAPQVWFQLDHKLSISGDHI